MIESRLARRNHYVPVWYQKRFLRGPRSTIHYLDLNPPRIQLPSGRTITHNALRRRPPTACFRETDLYTTGLGLTLSDEVERILFGRIDTTGAAAVRAFADGDLRRIHEHFQGFFQYLNAQKLRTPKGLDWIKTRYLRLTQGELMREMQHLRYMHCTMWIECVREIVSAERADVKFLVTDHPVTMYNPAFSPASSACAYPEDPPIHLTGTQTLFALDAECCLILTNLEYAKDPMGVNPTTSRMNARYHGQTLARTDSMIRSRMLTSDEVTAINSVLKSRSRRYLAAYDEEWLFPEKKTQMAWEQVGELLLPPRKELFGFGGEIYIGYKDGTTGYQDAFGRTDISHEFLKNAPSTEPRHPADSCGCGSGRRYRRCCRGIPMEERPPWNLRGIRDRNRMFCNAVINILGLTEPQGWNNLRRHLRDEQVKRVHELLSRLWPQDTDIAQLLPRPDERVFRAVYMGSIDPRTIAVSVISLLAYFDEIIVLNPFPNPLYMKSEFSPTECPSQHKSQMLKNVSVLMTLRPFIEAGIIHFVPDPMDFNVQFRRTVMEMAENRTATWQPTSDELRRGVALARDDVERATLRLSARALRRLLRESQPDINSQELEDTLRHMRRRLADDPLALLQPVGSRAEGGELQVFRSMTLELALFISHLTGAAIYTDERVYWRQLHEQASVPKNVGSSSRWTPLTDKLDSLMFVFDADPVITMAGRRAGRLGRVRREFRRIWQTARGRGNHVAQVNPIRDLAVRLEAAWTRANMEWATCEMSGATATRFRARMELSAPPSGFSMTTVHRLLVTYGRPNCTVSMPMSLYVAHDDVHDE
ncbi:MAG: DUF4238 domain-containing protein [Rhodospirillaceae bacterium]|nr:DUF4238 domain-containing protein [Rhodospirillaceae bacterium]